MTGPSIRLDDILPVTEGPLDLDSLLSSSIAEDEPNYIAERLKGGGRSLAEVGVQAVLFPAAVASGGRLFTPDFTTRLIAAKRQRALLQSLPDDSALGVEGRAAALRKVDQELIQLGEEAKGVMASRRARQAHERVGGTTLAQRKLQRFTELSPLDRYVEVLGIVSGFKDMPPDIDEGLPMDSPLQGQSFGPVTGQVGPLAPLERGLIGLTSFPGHIYRAFVQARENQSEQELGQAIGTAAGTVALFGAPFARKPTPPVDLAARSADYITSGVTRRVMDDLAQQRTLEQTPVRDVKFTRDIELPSAADPIEGLAGLREQFPDIGFIAPEPSPATAHLGAEVRPGEVFRGPASVSLRDAELAAIKQRLFLEEEGNVAQTLIRAHRELTPFGTTVIAGVEQAHTFSIANAILRAEERLQGGKVSPGQEIMHTATWYRPDGKADVAVYGDRSPLMNEDARIQFKESGFFEGQEVSYNGRNYIYKGAVEPEGPAILSPLSAQEIRAPEGISPKLESMTFGDQLAVPLMELRRPSYIASAEPFAAELHTRNYTVGDVMNITNQADRLRTGAPKGVQAELFDGFIARALGREQKQFTTGEPVSQTTGFRPGMNVVPLYDRYLELGQLFDNPGPETSLFVYADPNGQAVGFMEVGSLFNFGFPGTGKQIMAGVEKPVFGKHAAAVTGWMIHPYAHPALQARAALSLMEKAGELKVTQLLAHVDEVGARLAARYMNKYTEMFPRKIEIRGVRARVQEIAPTLDALFEDFKVYQEAAKTGDPKVVQRFGGNGNVRASEPVNLEQGVPLEDAPPPSAENGLGFDAVVKQFARERGFLPEEVAGLSRYLGQRLAKEGRELYLTPEEQALFTRLEKKMREAHGGEPSPLQVLTELPRMPLDYLAVSNDMLAQWTPSGIIEVRARESGQLLGRFRNESSARDFINGSGQAEGPHLDGGGRANDIPPSAIAGGLMPPAPPRPPTNAVADGLNILPPGGRLPRIVDMLRTQMEYFSPMEGWVSSIDNTLGSNFSPGFRATQAALRKAQAPMLDFLKRLHKEVDEPFFKGLTQEQRAMTFRAIETMTPDEVINSGFFRPLNSNEINIANWLAERHIDTARTLKYGRELLELEKRLADDPAALGEAVAELTKRYGLDPDHTIAAATFNEIRKKDPNEIFIGHITRLADAVMSDAPSRANFIKTHKLPTNTLEAIRRLENILDEVATRVGVPDERRIRGWIAHFRAQMEPKGTLSQAFLGQRGLGEIPEMKFLNELARTGEISMVELDPVIAATRYIRGAFLSQEFIPTWNATLKAWQAELGKLPAGARQKVERVLKSYLSELRGIPEASVQFTDEIVRRMTTEMGLDFSVDFRRSVVNTIISASSAGTMAFRLAMGLRDFASGAVVGTAWFGPARFNRMMKLGWDDATVAALHNKGLIPPTLTPIEFSSPVDLQTSLLMHKLPERLNRIADVGLRSSLQPLVYDRLNAGAYLEAHELASANFVKLAAGKINKAKAYENMMIDVYEPSFIREFDALVEGQKYEAAADLLGTQTQRMITPTYGLANHPYKWGTNTGRLIGQFGTWATWSVTNTLRMATRGSAATRFRVLSRLAMTQAAIYLTGKALGFDLYSWLLLSGLRWLGGPLVGTGRALMNLFSPSEQEQALAKQEMARLAPSLSDPRSLYVPGSYALGDYLQAFGVLGDPERRPSNPVEFLGRGIGIPVSKDPSWLDQLLQTQ